jgi:hypothetical protein
MGGLLLDLLFNSLELPSKPWSILNGFVEIELLGNHLGILLAGW